MNGKQKKTFILGIGIVLLVLAVILFFVLRLQQDKENTSKQAKRVISQFEEFSDCVAGFSATRDLVYTKVFANTFYETLAEQDSEYRETFSKYEESVLAVEDASKELLGDCKVLYAKSDANQKCAAFALMYERTINFFLDDLKEYNNHIDLYNDWAKQNGKDVVLSHYEEQKVREYVDYDGDSVYSGKDVSE